MDHDYYSTVYTWFEKCGIISNIRTHLRQNLINALKNKDLVLRRDNAPKSAKQYVYDLLIAEYLFNRNYAYTLSVFASEAPLLMNFHNKPDRRSDGDQRDNSEKLQNDYILHTLETLGINPNGFKGRYVMSQYIENDIPLLLCILKCITVSPFDTNNVIEKEEKSFCNISTQTEASQQSDARLLALKKKILHQKQVIDNSFHEREMRLKEQAVIMEQQLISLNEKLQQIQIIMHNITAKERLMKEKKQDNEQHIVQKEMELTLKEKLLQQENDRLQRESNHYKKFEEDLKKLQEELFKVQKELPRGDTRVVCSVKDIEVQTDFPNSMINDEEIEMLAKENKELTALVEEQKLRIEQITQRALQLSRQVEAIQLLRPTSVEVPTQTVNINTVISESSSTEDILQDAKIRLKRLEEESLKADQYYYNFINTSPL